MRDKIKPMESVTYLYSKCPFCFREGVNRVLATVNSKAYLVQCRICGGIFKIKKEEVKNE